MEGHLAKSLTRMLQKHLAHPGLAARLVGASSRFAEAVGSISGQGTCKNHVMKAQECGGTNGRFSLFPLLSLQTNRKKKPKHLDHHKQGHSETLSQPRGAQRDVTTKRDVVSWDSQWTWGETGMSNESMAFG